MIRDAAVCEVIGEDQRFFMPASALAGAAVLSASSVVSMTIVDSPSVYW